MIPLLDSATPCHPISIILSLQIIQPVQERDDLPPRTVLIDSERALLRSRLIAGRDLVLIAPENGLIEGVRFCDILERRLRDRFRGRFAHHPPEEHHALSAAYISVDAECTVIVALRDAILISPQDRFVEGMGLRHILERTL